MLNKLWFLIFLFLISCDSSDITVKNNKSNNNLSNKFSNILDETFANSGTLLLSDATENKVIKSSVIDSSGNIYLAGHTQLISTGLKTLSVWKVDNTGSVDTSFATGGRYVYEGSSNDEDSEALDIKLDSNQRPIVSGFTEDSNRARTLAIRLTTSGSLDTTFGSSGYYIYTHPNAGTSEGERARCLDIDSSGNIYLGGQGYFNNDKSLKVWKLALDGSLDTSFATSGLWNSHGLGGGGGADKIIDCKIHNNSLIIAGYTWGGSSAGKHKAFIGKISLSGVVDTSFADNGFAILDDLAGSANQNDLIDSLTITNSGIIYVSGRSSNGVDNDAFIYSIGIDGNESNSSLSIYNDVLNNPGSDNIYDIKYLESDESLIVCGSSLGDNSVSVGFVGKIKENNLNITKEYEDLNGNSSLNSISLFQNNVYVSGSQSNVSSKSLVLSKFK